MTITYGDNIRYCASVFGAIIWHGLRTLSMLQWALDSSPGEKGNTHLIKLLCWFCYEKIQRYINFISIRNCQNDSYNSFLLKTSLPLSHLLRMNGGHNVSLDVLKHFDCLFNLLTIGDYLVNSKQLFFNCA